MVNDVFPNEKPFTSGNSVVATDYTFDASAKTVVIASSNYKRMLYIVNTTFGEVIYNPYNDKLGGTLSATGVTLDFDTATSTFMTDGDDLLVMYEADVQPAFPYTWDFADRVDTSTTVDTWTFKTGGSGGTTVGTSVITYTDSFKTTVSTIALS